MDSRTTPHSSLAYDFERFDENSWMNLLSLIEKGEVVPVGGPELMEAEEANNQGLFHTWTARALAKSFFRVGLAVRHF